MSGGLEKDTKKGIEDFKEIRCEPVIRNYISRIYIINHENEYFIVFDPGYAYGNIYIYKQMESIPVTVLEREFKEAGELREICNELHRRHLVHYFIKKRFIKEPDLEYDLCYMRSIFA
jgi:hypothetical protein